MTAQACLSREQLQQFMLGAVSEAEWESVSAHLEMCPHCEQTLAGVDSTADALVRVVREIPQEHAANEEPSIYRLAARRAKTLAQVPAPIKPGKSQWLRDYELLHPVARGGMGTVYRAVHRRLQREVAVKVLPARCLNSSQMTARFQREMQAIGQLRHPAIVQATDGGEEDGVHFLVMEFVDGADLAKIVRALGPLETADAAEIVRRTAIGLAHAHERGIIHRDVKPSNVMLTADGEIRILDLGLARIMGDSWLCDELTTVGQLMGTLDYMAPEQFENSHEADERCDIYGLGATLFKLLTGRTPYGQEQGESPLAKLRRIANGPPASLADLRPDLSATLCRVVDQSLARSPADRPRDMLQFAESLAPFCPGHRLDRLVGAARERMKADEVLTSDMSGNSQLDSKSRRPDPADAAAAVSPRTRPRAARRWNWMLSGLLLAVFAAVVATVITLQTGDGQLVIETTVPDVTVEIKRSGKRVETLTVSHQSNRLQLRAGEYEVQVVGKSDGLHIENQNFTLRRGEQVVARIVHESAPALAERASPVPSGIQVAPKPTFDGKTASEWVAVLYEDRSPARVASALQALKKLGIDAEQPQRAIAGVFHAARFHDERNRYPSPVWSAAVATLRSFDEQAVFAEASRRLDDEDYQPKLFVSHLLLSLASSRTPVSAPPMVPEGIIARLTRLVESGPEDERILAMNALQAIHGQEPAFIAQCVKWLEADDLRLRLHAAESLIQGQQEPQTVVAALQKLLQSSEPSIQYDAIMLLGLMKEDAAGAVPDLIEVAKQYVPGTEIRPRTRIIETRTPVVYSSNSLLAMHSLQLIGDERAIPPVAAIWQRLRAEAAANLERSDASKSAQSIGNFLETLTGLSLTSGRVMDEQGNRWVFEWRQNRKTLREWCIQFREARANSTDEKSAIDAIRRLLVVHTEFETMDATARALAASGAGRDKDQALLALVYGPAADQRKVESAFEAIGLLSESQVSVKEGLRDAVIAYGKRTENRLLFSATVHVHQRLEELFQIVKELAEADARMRQRTFELLTAAINRGDFYFLQVLLMVDPPDAEQSQQLIAALQKAGEGATEGERAALDRALEHLRQR